MAQVENRLISNLEGPFFVDSSCINCGTCWQTDPKHFSSGNTSSFVQKQPKNSLDASSALLALLDCPVGAIGASRIDISKLRTDVFPILIENHHQGEIYYCGWSSKKSFGASSWLIIQREGNVLIDSPRWSIPLAKRIKGMGGLSEMVLTHQDDVADHSKWATEFKCERWIHKDDAKAAPKAENQIMGTNKSLLRKNLQLIPVPGHTKGSIVALFGDKKQIIFTGDHLWWNPVKKAIVASKEYCWWSWREQIESIKKLLDFDISLLLPAHGYMHKFQPGEWKQYLNQTIKYLDQKESI